MTTAFTETNHALQERIADVQRRIVDATARSGRSAGAVTLVAVSKTVGREQVDAAYALGVHHFGENRVQEALQKFGDRMPDDLVLHLIGTLQTNKARHAVGRFDLIHSLDRASLADELDKRSERAGLLQPVLIQVNVSGEEQKHGCSMKELPSLIEHTLSCPHLQLNGLMTMAPFVATPEEARPVFAGLREARDRIQERYPEATLSELSMGMTNDYPVAVEEGATIVRVGRAIFAEPGQG